MEASNIKTKLAKGELIRIDNEKGKSALWTKFKLVANKEKEPPAKEFLATTRRKLEAPILRATQLVAAHPI